jgi:AcrR family transcriptional regulator
VSERQRAILDAAVRVIARTGVRGLRVEQLAAEAGISTALIYYHFGDRAGLLRRTLEHVSDRAADYTQPAADVETMLLQEMQDTEAVRTNSTAWGELRASAVFNDELRDTLAESTRVWTAEVADAISQVRPDAPATDAAERLTALVEGLSERWLSGSITLDRARELLRGAVALELTVSPPAPR